MGWTWFKNQKLQGRGTLHFACPLHNGLRSRPPEPFVLFAELLSKSQGQLVVESNAAALLVRAAPPHP